MTAEITDPHDRFFRYLFSQPEIAADFCRHFLAQELSSVMDLDELPQPLKDTYLDERLRKHFTDVLYRVPLKAGGGAYVCLLWEHKSDPEKNVGFQIFRYEARIWEQVGFNDNGLLPPILSIVFYNGPAPWTVPQEFSALVDFAGSAALRPFVPEFRYVLCDLSTLDEARLKRGAAFLQTGMAAMRAAFSHDLDEKLSAILAPMGEITGQNALEYICTVLQYLARAGKQKLTEVGIKRAIAETYPKQGEKAVLSVVDNWIEQGKLQGIELGLAQGHKIGHELGHESGRRAEAVVFVTRLLRRCGIRRLKRAAREKIEALSVAQLEDLGDALFDFKGPADLDEWLARRSQETPETVH
jgi:hypothetical protein